MMYRTQWKLSLIEQKKKDCPEARKINYVSQIPRNKEAASFKHFFVELMNQFDKIEVCNIV